VLFNLSAEKSNPGHIEDPKAVVRLWVESTTDLGEAKSFLAAAETHWPKIGEELWAKELKASPLTGYIVGSLTPTQVQGEKAAPWRLRFHTGLDLKDALAAGIVSLEIQSTIEFLPPPAAKTPAANTPAVKSKDDSGMAGANGEKLEPFEIVSGAGPKPFDFWPKTAPANFAGAKVTLRVTPKNASGKLSPVTRVIYFRPRIDGRISAERWLSTTPQGQSDGPAADAAAKLRSFYDDARSMAAQGEAENPPAKDVPSQG